MLKVGGILAAIVVVGFIVFPQFRPMIIGTAPFAILALCPISMIAMMFMMKGKDTSRPANDDKETTGQSEN